jgi:hypothetical protein
MGMVRSGEANRNQIDRAACRARALQNFSAKRMADGYEAIYRKLLEKTPVSARYEEMRILREGRSLSGGRDVA